MVLPGSAESDVRQADGAPSEKGGKTRKSGQPGEDDAAVLGEGKISEGRPDEDGEDRRKGTARLVDVGEDLGGVSLLSKGSEGSRSAVNTRNTDGQDRDQNDNVHEVIEALEVGIFGSKDERRGLDVVTRVVTAEEAFVIVWHKETDKEETKNVEESNTPEDLLDGTRHSLDGVLGLGGSKTDKLSTGEGESSSDEDGAKALEAVGKGTGVIPCFGALVVVVPAAAGATAEDENESDDHEDDGGSEFEARCPELLFSVAESTKNVDDDDGDEEDGDPYRLARMLVPILDGQCADSQFERKDDCPLEHIVPTHGETPRGINEASRVSVETTRDRVHDTELSESID